MVRAGVFFPSRFLSDFGFDFDFVGGKDLEEIELTHLDGHKGSRPVRCVAFSQMGFEC